LLELKLPFNILNMKKTKLVISNEFIINSGELI
jgi:hypothetical protein